MAAQLHGRGRAAARRAVPAAPAPRQQAGAEGEGDAPTCRICWGPAEGATGGAGRPTILLAGCRIALQPSEPWLSRKRTWQPGRPSPGDA